MLFSQKKDIIGIDIGASSVKLVQLKEHKSGYSLQNVGLMPLPLEAIVDNSLMDTSSIVEAIQSLVKSLTIKAKDVACSISGNSVIIRKIALPLMSSEELEDQIQWEAEQYIPFDINDVNIDFQILASDTADADRMNVLLVASKKDIINDYVTVFNEAGLHLVVMDVDSFAVQNAFEVSHDVAFDEVVALVNIGASIMNLNIIRNGISLFTRDVQIGGNLYNEEIQKQFNVSSDEAENLKMAGDNGKYPQLPEVVGRVTESIAQEMRRSMDFYSSDSGEGKISRIVLSGGCSKTAGMVPVLEQRLGIPVELLNPFNKIKYNEKEFDPDYLAEIGPLVVVAVGLAVRKVGDK